MQQCLFADLQIFADLAQLHRQQLSVMNALFALEVLIPACSGSLALQAIQLLINFFAQIVQTLKIFLGMRDAIFGVAAQFFVLGDTGCFFDESAQFFRTRLDHAGDHALFDDGVTACAQSRAQE